MMIQQKQTLSFEELLTGIHKVHEDLSAQAGRAVNISLTLRNWLIGCYISEYELHGKDRAKYGEGLLKEISSRLTALKISNCNRRQLYDYLKFFKTATDLSRDIFFENSGHMILNVQ